MCYNDIFVYNMMYLGTQWYICIYSDVFPIMEHHLVWIDCACFPSIPSLPKTTHVVDVTQLAKMVTTETVFWMSPSKVLVNEEKVVTNE